MERCKEDEYKLLNKNRYLKPFTQKMEKLDKKQYYFR